MIKPVLVKITSSVSDDLSTYKPESPDYFGFSAALHIRPDSGDIDERFTVLICSPKWYVDFFPQLGHPFQLGYSKLFTAVFDWPEIYSAIEEFLESCQAPTWVQVAGRICRLASWEHDGWLDFVWAGPGQMSI